jgi:hypothetical protein
MFCIVHWTNGLVLLILSLLNISIGLSLNDGWVKKPAKDFLVVAVIISVVCAALAELLRKPERFKKDKGANDDSVVRHLYALMAATALAATVTMCTIVNDSDDL